jgi:hypothetical protein
VALQVRQAAARVWRVVVANPDGDYAGAVDGLFRLVERCADERKDESVVALIHYRAEVGHYLMTNVNGMCFKCISPLQTEWIGELRQLIHRFLIEERERRPRREKALNVLHETFTRWRAVSEQNLVNALILPLLKNVALEKDSVIQVHLSLSNFVNTKGFSTVN